MAPKAKKGANAQNKKAAEDEREEPFQAVVFADSFETTFAPFTLERPRCLLQVANTPLIDYTCEFLASSGVQEVILYCSNHPDQVETYLKASKWMQQTSPFSLRIIRSNSRSVGDAMRDLDQKQLITGDFLCVYGDVVANVPLDGAIAAHRIRREKDKKAIMTMVLRDAGDHPRTMATETRSAFVLEPQSQRCVHYEQIRPKITSRLEIADEILKEHVEIEVREDLIDCGIDICTPEVLAQYTDNFDWQHPRRGFLYGILKDYETNQLTVHTHIMDQGYAARVRNPQSYDSVSRDVASRWAYPLCPDSNLLPHQNYRARGSNVYAESSVVLAPLSSFGRNSVIGAATTVGTGTVISNSVIGRRCIIGNRVKIEGAYIWDDVRIDDDSDIEKAIIADKTSVGSGCHVRTGALISYGVVIADGISVKNVRVTTFRMSGDAEEAEHKDTKTDVGIVGEGGRGYVLEVGEEEDPLEGLLYEPIDVADELVVSDDSISSLGSDDEADSHGGSHRNASSRSGSFASIASDESGDAAHKRAVADFHHEATQSVVDALQNDEDADTIQLELQALKLSSNAEDKQVRRAIAVSFIKRIVSLVESGLSPKAAVDKAIPPNKLLVTRCVTSNRGRYDEQVEFLMFMQTDLVHRKQGSKILLNACYTLTTHDLVEAEGVELWWEDARSSANEELRLVREETEPLVRALTGDDDDEEEEDDDDDSE